jgi:hypothetical protein
MRAGPPHQTVLTLNGRNNGLALDPFHLLIHLNPANLPVNPRDR